MRPTIKITIYLLCLLLLTVACNKDDGPVLEQVYFPKLIQFHSVTVETDYYRTSTYSLSYNENSLISSIQILTSIPSSSFNTLLEFEYSGNVLSKIIAKDITNNTEAESTFNYTNGKFVGFDYVTGGAEYNIGVTYNETENTYTTSTDNPKTYGFDSDNAFTGLSGPSISNYVLNFAMNRKAPFAKLFPSPELIIWFNEIDVGISDLYYFTPYFIESIDSDNNSSDVQYEDFVTDSEGNLIKYSSISSSTEGTCDIVYELRSKQK